MSTKFRLNLNETPVIAARDKQIAQLQRQLKAAKKMKNYFKAQNADRLSCLEYAQDEVEKLRLQIARIQSYMKGIVI
jgi:hypothetical protein